MKESLKIIDKILEEGAGGYNSGVGASHTSGNIGALGSVPTSYGTVSVKGDNKKSKRNVKKSKKDDKSPFGDSDVEYKENETPEMLRDQNKRLNDILNDYNKKSLENDSGMYENFKNRKQSSTDTNSNDIEKQNKELDKKFSEKQNKRLNEIYKNYKERSHKKKDGENPKEIEKQNKELNSVVKKNKNIFYD